MLQRFFNLTIILASLLLSTSALAGGGSGKVTNIGVHKYDVVMFSVETNTTTASCVSAPAHIGVWAFSLKTETGRAMYSLLLSAQAQGLSVTVWGTGDCDAWGDREEAYYVVVNFLQ